MTKDTTVKYQGGTYCTRQAISESRKDQQCPFQKDIWSIIKENLAKIDHYRIKLSPLHDIWLQTVIDPAWCGYHNNKEELCRKFTEENWQADGTDLGPRNFPWFILLTRAFLIMGPICPVYNLIYYRFIWTTKSTKLQLFRCILEDNVITEGQFDLKSSCKMGDILDNWIQSWVGILRWRNHWWTTVTFSHLSWLFEFRKQKKRSSCSRGHNLI